MVEVFNILSEMDIDEGLLIAEIITKYLGNKFEGEQNGEGKRLFILFSVLAYYEDIRKVDVINSYKVHKAFLDRFKKL
jgi:hypothetical protein